MTECLESCLPSFFLPQTLFGFEPLQEFQKLKELILNRQQLKIFNYLIPFNNPKLSIKKKTLQMEKQNEILEFFQYLHNGIELNEFSKLDLKLKRLMEKTFQKS